MHWFETKLYAYAISNGNLIIINEIIISVYNYISTLIGNDFLGYKTGNDDDKQHT